MALDLSENSFSPLRIAVCGIGRSGTTLLYQQIAKALNENRKTTNFRYEPYLWNIQSASAEGHPFDMSEISHFGLHVHTNVPLFLDGADVLHDSFIDDLFGSKCDDAKSQLPDAYLTKIIRVSGRLRS